MAGYIKLQQQQQLHDSFNLVAFFKWHAYLYRHYLLHIIHDIKNSKLNYFLGFCACFLVVFVVSLVVTIIGNTPIVFLRLAELQKGEVDMKVVSRSPSNSHTALNYTQIEEILSHEKEFSYHSPRYELNGLRIVPQRTCKNNLDPYDSTWKYIPTGCTECFYKNCPFDNDVVTNLHAIDTERENRMEYGRGWNLPPPKEGYL